MKMPIPYESMRKKDGAVHLIKPAYEWKDKKDWTNEDITQTKNQKMVGATYYCGIKKFNTSWDWDIGVVTCTDCLKGIYK